MKSMKSFKVSIESDGAFDRPDPSVEIRIWSQLTHQCIGDCHYGSSHRDQGTQWRCLGINKIAMAKNFVGPHYHYLDVYYPITSSLILHQCLNSQLYPGWYIPISVDTNRLTSISFHMPFYLHSHCTTIFFFVTLWFTISLGKLTISMAMFNCYVTNYQRVNPMKPPLHPIKPPFSRGFPIFFPIISR